MKIAEIYYSVQGEGLLTGSPSIFVRTSGCNLRCHFCDTRFASWEPEGEHLSVEQIVQQVQQQIDQQGGIQKCRHVVLTGGEPMMFPELVPLCEQLNDLGLHLTIETAGTLFLSLPCHLMSISPKMSNSTPSLDEAGGWHKQHERVRYRPEVVQQLMNHYEYQLKFVVDVPADVQELLQYLNGFDSHLRKERVLLMPQGVTQAGLQQKAPWIKQKCEELGFRFSPRSHIEWFGNRRGT